MPQPFTWVLYILGFILCVLLLRWALGVFGVVLY